MGRKKKTGGGGGTTGSPAAHCVQERSLLVIVGHSSATSGSGAFAEGLDVKVSPGGLSGKTDADGLKEFKDLKPGTYQVAVSLSATLAEKFEIEPPTKEAVTVPAAGCGEALFVVADTTTVKVKVKVLTPAPGRQLKPQKVSLKSAEGKFTATAQPDGTWVFAKVRVAPAKVEIVVQLTATDATGHQLPATPTMLELKAQPQHLVEIEATEVPPEFHLHVDADRDGKVDDDRTDIDKWTWGASPKGRGAILLCNNDDDASRGNWDHADDKVNGSADLREVAPLELRRVGANPAPAAWKGFISVPAGLEKFVRIFDGHTATSKELVGPSKGVRGELSDLKFTKLELGIEANRYADAGWDGFVDVSFEVEQAPGKVVRETARFRVAPWLAHHHLEKGEKVFVVSAARGAVVPDANPPLFAKEENNFRFIGQLDKFVKDAGATLQRHTGGDIWMQDCMEIGHASLPGAGLRSTCQAWRQRPLFSFPATLRAKDIGYHEPGSGLDGDTFDSTGNLECFPPCRDKNGKEYPFGRLYFGPGRPGQEMNSSVRGWLNKQEVQPPIEIDTNWLTVGHVDEIISVVPAAAATHKFAVLMASPKLAYKLIDDAIADGKGASRMLVGRKFPEFDLVAGTFEGWLEAETTLTDFTTKGLPGLAVPTRPAANLDAAAVRKFNDDKQVLLDATRKLLRDELGLADTDFIPVPILFIPSEGTPAHADALTAGMVNMIVLDTHCIFPMPFGPVVGGKDLFQENYSDSLKKLGLAPHAIDDWYEYHVQLGEVHCGTNTLRATSHLKWWEFTP